MRAAEFFVRGGNTHGDAAPTVRRFSEVVLDEGAAIDGVTTGADGTTARVARGVYAVTYSDRGTPAVNGMAITRGGDPMASPEMQMVGARMIYAETPENITNTITAFAFLDDELLRAQSPGGLNATSPASVSFRVTQISDVAASPPGLRMVGGAVEGSTGNTRGFATVDLTTGNSITQETTPAGTIFSIVEPGVYAVMYWDEGGGSESLVAIARSLPASTAPESIDPAARLVLSRLNGNGMTCSVAAVSHLVNGDQIRAINDGAPNAMAPLNAGLHIIQLRATSTAPPEIHLTGGMGYGTTATTTRRFAVQQPTGDTTGSLSVSQDAANGTHVDVVRAGLHAITYWDCAGSAGAPFGITRNGDGFRTVGDHTGAQLIAMSQIREIATCNAITVVTWLDAGDIIRAQSDESMPVTGSETWQTGLRITRIFN